MNEKTTRGLNIPKTTMFRRLLQLGQLLDRLPEDDGAGDVDVEGADQPTLGDLHTIIHLRWQRIFRLRIL